MESLGLPDYVLKDLEASGLVPLDLNARIIDNPERAITLTPYSVNGYVLPYFSMQGKLLPHYRVRLFDSDQKYRQPKDSQNHVYFPKSFAHALMGKNYVVITEGEKKAAAACKAGIPTVGLGGVDSWRNRTILISGDADLKQHKNKLAVKLPSGDGEVHEDFMSPLAVGFVELLDLIIDQKLKVVIAYDIDIERKGCSAEAQRAAATLGYELRFRGIPFVDIKQLVLPTPNAFDYTGDKMGLDDYLTYKGGGRSQLQELLNLCLSQKGNFPLHPNVREYINKRLQKGSLSRKETQSVSLAILSDMDSRGMRLRGLTGDTYYFDKRSKKLLKSHWPTSGDGAFDSPFTQFIYKEFGLSGADHRLLQWLGTAFAAEDPIENVNPYRVFARPDVDEDAVYYQVSDSQYAKVSAQGLSLHQNGEGNILFESEQVDPLDPEKLVQEFNLQSTQVINFWWATTLSQVRLRDKDKQRVVASLLYYMSPWLFRWRGMQLPVELIVGESGSGKSTLCELRLDILTGRPLLRNTPADLKDWHASITNSGGLHVTDNVQLVDQQLRQRLSDEICRIVTEPDPFVEQRKYYTNADILRIPVRTVFALTAIQQPFQNADLIQRAFILELDKSLAQSESGVIRYDSKWKANQLGVRRGREGWVAHHLVVLQRFFKLVQEKWNDDYLAKQRLINFEQSMLLMTEVFKIPNNWIPDYLVTASDNQITDADVIMEALNAFAWDHYQPEYQHKSFYASTISDWCSNNDDYKGHPILTNPRKLGRYIRARKSAIYAMAGIHEHGTIGNKVCYRFDQKPQPRRPIS